MTTAPPAPAVPPAQTAPHAVPTAPASHTNRRAPATSRLLVASVAALALAGLTACATPSTALNDGEGSAAASPFDLTAASVDDRVRIDPVPEAIDALKQSGFEPIQDGKLTIAVNAYEPPLSLLAEDDNQTLLGTEPDIAQLVADGLDLELASENVAWADWPLGVESGKYDAIASNVTVTEERKDLFDFAVYRNDVLSFAVAANSDIESISEAKDVAGLRVAVGSGTNQEKILLDWFAENEKNGLDAGEPVYYEDNAAGFLAVSSGRIDAAFGPNPSAAYRVATTDEWKVVGTVNGGYPETAQIGVATAKGNGLVDAVSIVLNHVIETGDYQAVLERWQLTDEAVEESLVNPPGLPRP